MSPMAARSHDQRRLVCLEQLTIILTNLKMSADHLNVWERERGEGDKFAAAAAPSRPGI